MARWKIGPANLACMVPCVSQPNALNPRVSIGVKLVKSQLCRQHAYGVHAVCTILHSSVHFHLKLRLVCIDCV
jgi:hypothetical protein